MRIDKIKTNPDFKVRQISEVLPTVKRVRFGHFQRCSAIRSLARSTAGHAVQSQYLMSYVAVLITTRDSQQTHGH